jgi:hypothetical protein
MQACAAELENGAGVEETGVSADPGGADLDQRYRGDQDLDDEAAAAAQRLKIIRNRGEDMRQGHKYEDSDNRGVSAIFRMVRLGKEMITIHHTLKDLNPQSYWFTIFHQSTEYMDFDVREWWKAVGMTEIDPQSWLSRSHQYRLEFVAHLAEKAFAAGHDLVKIVGGLQTPPQIPGGIRRV